VPATAPQAEPPASSRSCAAHHQGQRHLFDECRYRYIETDLPASVTTQDMVVWFEIAPLAWNLAKWIHLARGT